MTRLRWILLPLLFIFWAGCGNPSSEQPPPELPLPTTNTTGAGTDDTPPPPATEPPVAEPHSTVATLTVAPAEVKLSVGGTQSFSVEVRNTAGEIVNDVEIDWSVSDATVVSVEVGQVTALKVGTTFLIASHSGIKSTAFIGVVPPPVIPPTIASIEITSAVTHLKVGAQQPLQATAKDRSGVKIEGVTFSWASSNPNTAAVDENGLVTALQPGQVTIAASADRVGSAPFSLVVEEPRSPIARISASTRQGSAPLAVRFNGGASSDPDGIIAAYEWDFGDGSSPSSLVSVDHTFQAEGSYLVTLKVTGDSGRTGLATVTFSATPPVPPGDCTPAATIGWERVNGPALGDMWGIHFVNPCEGWTVGMAMALAHTTDGGKTWNKQENIHWLSTPPEIPPDIYDVFFLDKNTGWAAGWPELILSTTDGGATWHEQHLNRHYATASNFCGIWEGSVCTKKKGVYLRRIRFANPQEGWVVGRFGYIFRTTNGGAKWTDVKITNPAFPPCEGHTTYNPHWFGLDVQSVDEIWISGGWDDGNGCPGWNRVIIHTLNRGANWIYQNDLYQDVNNPALGRLEGSGRYQDLHLIGDEGWAVGEVGTILHTKDHGATWKRISGAGAGGATLWGLSFTDPMNVWITGSNGVLVHSPDGGPSWCKHDSGTGTQLRRSSFLDPNFGWIAGQDKIFRTTAGGKPQPQCVSP